MKFSINSRTLLSHLLATYRAINNKPTIAILSNFRFSLHDGVLQITGADCDCSITTKVVVEYSEGSGDACIEAKRLVNIMKAIPDGDVEFEINGLNVDIIHKKGKYKLTALPADEFPKEKNLSEDNLHKITMPSNALASALSNVLYAVSNDDYRPILQGICVDVKADSVIFVATDTRMLSKYRCTFIEPNAEFCFNLPARFPTFLQPFSSKNEKVDLYVASNGLACMGRDFVIYSSLIPGNFPDYNRVIPIESTYSVTIEREAFLNAINRLSLCADSTSNLIRVEINSDTMLLKSQDVNFGVASEELMGCTSNCDSMVIGFNSEYLKKSLSNIGTSSVVMKLTDKTRPAIILPTSNEEHSELTILCMPMTTN